MDLSEFIETIPLAKKAAVLNFDDCGLIAFDKGSGLMSHPNPNIPNPDNHPFIRARYNFKQEYYSWPLGSGERARLYLINRLDSPTSGVILASASEEVAKAVKESFKQKSAQKTYFAICKGKFPGNSGQWSDFLEVKNFGNFVRGQVSRKGPLKALTKFEFVRADENKLGLYLMKLEPLTGRTHQLRIQCAKHNLPIVGDQTYGDFALNREIRRISSIPRMFLHCGATRVEFEYESKNIVFEAKSNLPDSFKEILTYNGIFILKSRKAQHA